MYLFIQGFHSGWAYLTLLLIICATIISCWYFLKKKKTDKFLRKSVLLAMIALHVQVLIGIFLLFTSPMINYAIGMSEIMKNSQLRLYHVEHPVTMIVAAVFLTIAHRKVKSSQVISGSAFCFVGIALILLLSRIPYSAWIG